MSPAQARRGTRSNDEDSAPLTSPSEGTTPDAEAIRRYNEANVKPTGAAFDTAEYLDGDGKSLDLTKIADDGAATVVTVDRDVYERFPAPGAPNRMINRLLFHKGQVVPKAALAERQRVASGSKSYEPVEETK